MTEAEIKNDWEEMLNYIYYSNVEKKMKKEATLDTG